MHFQNPSHCGSAESSARAWKIQYGASAPSSRDQDPSYSSSYSSSLPDIDATSSSSTSASNSSSPTVGLPSTLILTLYLCQSHLTCSRCASGSPKELMPQDTQPTLPVKPDALPGTCSSFSASSRSRTVTAARPSTTSSFGCGWPSSRIWNCDSENSVVSGLEFNVICAAFSTNLAGLSHYADRHMLHIDSVWKT